MVPRVIRFLTVAALLTLATGCGPKPPGLLRALLIASGQDPDRQAALAHLADRLTERGEVAVEVARDFSVPEQPNLARGCVLVFCPGPQAELSPAARQAMLQHVRSGGGLVAMSDALSAFRGWPEWAELVGGMAAGPDGSGPCECVTLDTGHAVMLGMGGHFEIPGPPGVVEHLDPAAVVLARRVQPAQPQVWIKAAGEGRVVAVAFGRNQRALDDEWFITLLHNAIRWAGRQLPDTCHNVLTPAERQEGYEMLFNGKDLSGWPEGTAHWTVEHGELVGRADQLPADSFLIGARPYGDFILRFSVRLPDGQGNSGLIVHSGRLPDGAVLGFAVDIAPGRYGTIYEEGGQRGVLAEGWKGKGETVAILDGWNDVEVRAAGGKITVILNGLTTAEYTVTASDPEPARGPIALELHRDMHMEVRFRDMRIKRLEK